MAENDTEPTFDDDLAGSSADEAKPAFSDESAVEELSRLFDNERQAVRFSRQLEVMFENRWFHWITNRAVRRLVREGLLVEDVRRLVSGNKIHLVWHRSYRYPKREAARVVELVEEYAHPDASLASSPTMMPSLPGPTGSALRYGTSRRISATGRP